MLASTTSGIVPAWSVERGNEVQNGVGPCCAHADQPIPD